MKIKIIVFLITMVTNMLYAETYYSFGEKIPLQPIHQNKEFKESGISYYQTPTGEKIGVKNEVIIGCKDMALCEPILDTYPVISVEKLSDTLYLLKLEKGSNPFDVANALYHEDVITLSHPNFIKKRKRR